MNGPVTLADLDHEGRKMWTYCCDCGRERDPEPASLPLPPDTPVPWLGRRLMRCSACVRARWTRGRRCTGRS